MEEDQLHEAQAKSPRPQIVLNDDYMCKGCVGTVAGLGPEGVLVVRREPGKPQPTYWLDAVPPEEVISAMVRTHVAIGGVLAGMVLLGVGVYMSVAIFLAPLHFRKMLMALGCMGVGIAWIFGCRRKKAVFETWRGRFTWISGPLHFPEARRQAVEIEKWLEQRRTIFR